MQVILKKTKITLSVEPTVTVPKALLIVGKGFDPIYADVVAGKMTYKLPKGVNYKDILAVYLRVI